MSDLFRKGNRVIVTNGQPQPPKHHTRKLSRWKNENYIGTVAEDESDYIVIEPDGVSCSFVRVRQLYRRNNLNGITLTKIREEAAQ